MDSPYLIVDNKRRVARVDALPDHQPVGDLTRYWPTAPHRSLSAHYIIGWIGQWPYIRDHPGISGDRLSIAVPAGAGSRGLRQMIQAQHPYPIVSLRVLRLIPEGRYQMVMRVPASVAEYLSDRSIRERRPMARVANDLIWHAILTQPDLLAVDPEPVDARIMISPPHRLLYEIRRVANIYRWSVSQTIATMLLSQT